jgi:hypothetical protein
MLEKLVHKLTPQYKGLKCVQYVDYNGRYEFSDSDLFRNAVVTNFRRPGQRTVNQGHYPHINDSSPDLSCRVVSFETVACRNECLCTRKSQSIGATLNGLFDGGDGLHVLNRLAS